MVEAMIRPIPTMTLSPLCGAEAGGGAAVGEAMDGASAAMSAIAVRPEESRTEGGMTKTR
jgi:hypothetical protein